MEQRKENIAEQVQAIRRDNSTVKAYEEAYRKYLSFVERGILEEPTEPLQVRVGGSLNYADWGAGGIPESRARE